MLAPELLESVFALPEADQLELIGRVRQRLLGSASTLTDADRQTLDEEIAAFATNGDVGLPWEDVEAEIRSSPVKL